MRTVSYEKVVEETISLIARTNYDLPEDVLRELKSMRRKETNELASSILDTIIENALIAHEDRVPLCQDTGIAVYFVEIGEETRIGSPGLEAALDEATSRGYHQAGLRMSIVEDPLRRKNTGDNTPSIKHVRIVQGDRLSITYCPKGGGCENMSRLAMLSPGEEREGVFKFVVDTVREGKGRPCPPVVVGVGIGGDFELSAIVAKEAVLRTIGEPNPDPFYRELEVELLTEINSLGIGPMGLGGDTTALGVFVKAVPCHIASLPVAVNIQCHSARHGTILL